MSRFGMSSVNTWLPETSARVPVFWNLSMATCANTPFGNTICPPAPNTVLTVLPDEGVEAVLRGEQQPARLPEAPHHELAAPGVRLRPFGNWSDSMLIQPRCIDTSPALRRGCRTSTRFQTGRGFRPRFPARRLRA